MLTFLLNLLLFLLILSILVLFHEFGHFIVAKKSGIKVEEFGFGLPPRIWGKKRGETTYSINALPIGGFVKLYGEEGETSPREKLEKDRAFHTKSKKIRFAVIIAGVSMNFLLSIIVFTIVFTKLGIPTNTGRVMISEIAKDSPAEQAGLKVDDVVISAGGETINSSDEFSKVTKKYSGREFVLEVFREKDNPCGAIVTATSADSIKCRGANIMLGITPRADPPDGQGPLGVGIFDEITAKFYPLPQQIVFGVAEGFKESWGWIKLIVGSLGTMVSQLFSKGQVPADVAGPIGIFQATEQVSKGGWLVSLQFLGILSLNLGVINILPLPALDGGRILFILIEALTGKKVRADIENKAHNLGMAFLLLLFLLITINDIVRILNMNNILSRIKSLFSF